MTYEEAGRWRKGDLKTSFYQEELEDAKGAQVRDEKLLKVVKPEQMPWEDTRQGLIKHLVHEKMDVRVKTLDIYMQELPPGGRSGKHSHTGEEYIYILEGSGYDIHWDLEPDIREKYYWKVSEEGKTFEWEEGDSVIIPVKTVHQHFNPSKDKPARFVSATNRIYKQVVCNDLEQIEDAPDYRD
jgi:quercetin dioxygenase-like cupin family protein